MDKKVMRLAEIKKYFEERGYNCQKSNPVAHNEETVFVTAGIQPILARYRKGDVQESKKIFIPQPVIRTQFASAVSEGSSIAFVNPTSSGFNISEEEHEQLVNDWLELFYELGMKKTDISTCNDYYEREWGDLMVEGKRTFYYHKDVEIGDATFFTKVTKDGKSIGVDSMSDLGFGLERLRWCANNKQGYFDLYSDSSYLTPDVKATLSVLALLAVNDIKPSNKNTGYRARLFSKKLAGIMNGFSMPKEFNEYLFECIKYWKEWQDTKSDTEISAIQNEYIRNCNRIILDRLINEGYTNVSGININIPKAEFKKRLVGSGVEPKKVDEYIGEME